MDQRLPIEAHYSDAMLREIGLLFLTTASIEGALSMQLMRLVCHPDELNPVGSITVWGMETKVKLEKIVQVAHVRMPKEGVERVARICSKLRRLFTRRNELAHFINVGGPRPDTIILKTLRVQTDGSLARNKTLSIKQIREFCLLLHGRALQLDACLTELGIRRLAELAIPIPEE